MPKLLVLAALMLGPSGVFAAQHPPASDLKIVVIAGEGGVNIIQQKTAVRPLIEVRDRNNVPVAGASVTFTIGGGGQSAVFAGGAQTLTVTTNVAGQAAASGLNAISSGAFQIEVQAAYQGQLATAAISQTNFATAAAAAQAGTSAGGASGATGGAAGGGGGLSATTIGIAAAAVGGGALAASQTVLKSNDEGGTNANTFNGALTGQIVFTSLATDPQGRQTSCARTRAVGGTITIAMAANNATGSARLRLTETEIAVAGGCGPAPGDQINMGELAVSGGPSALTFSGTAQTPGGSTTKLVFNGALSGNTITGTLSINIQATATGPNEPTGFGSTTLQVTLQK